MAVLAVSTAQAVFACIILVLGCCIGSFLNVCIWRLPRGLSINDPNRSFCPRCGKPIRGRDNIPVLSFVLLGGRCRDCGEPISWRYPAVEAATGALLVVLYLVQRVGAGTERGQVIVMGLLVALLVAASVVDMDFRIIPDEVSMFGLLAGLAAGLVLPEMHVGEAPWHTLRSLTGVKHLDGLIGAGIGALGGGGVVLLFAILGAWIFRKEAMGFGDVKLMAMVGAFLGWKVAVLAFFIAPFFGLLYGLPVLVLKKQHTMPFGPFLSAGTVLVMLLRTEACGWLERYIGIVGEIIRAVRGG